jgi:hypothetical protein
MKKAFYFLSFLFISFQIKAQLYIGEEFSNFYHLNWQRVLYTQNAIPENLKGEVKEIKRTTVSKKNKTILTEKFDSKGRILFSQTEGKKITSKAVEYNEKDYPILFKENKNGKVSYESQVTFDNQNRMIEKSATGKNGKFISRTVMTYGDGDCPITTDNYFKKKDNYSSRWVNTYYSACDKKSTVLYNKKGKIKKTWTYDCKQEGELLTPKKDVTQICKWDEENDKYFIKVTQDFDEKGKIRKKVQKYYKADTSIAETAFYNGSGIITYRFTVSYDTINNTRTSMAENFKKGISSSISTYTYKDKILIFREITSKGKLKNKEINTYLGPNKVKQEIYNKKGLISQTINTFENNNLITSQKIIKGKPHHTTKMKYNEKDLIVQTEIFNKKGKLESSATFEYVY